MGIFGNRLRSARSSIGMTQEELADRADITRAMVGRYESTDQMPSVETLVRLADALSISTDYLLGRDAVNEPDFSTQKNTKRKEKCSQCDAYRLENLIRYIVQDEMKK